MDPLNINDSAKLTVNRSALALFSAGILVTAFAVCFVANSSAAPNGFAIAFAAFVPRNGRNTVLVGSIAYAAIHVDAANAIDIVS